MTGIIDDRAWNLTVGAFVLLLVFLAVLLYFLRRGTVRVYNWDGRKYHFIGRSVIHRRSDAYVINIGEHLADVSYTTRYRFCPSRGFVRRNRYQNLLIRAGETLAWIPIEERMQIAVYFRHTTL